MKKYTMGDAAARVPKLKTLTRPAWLCLSKVVKLLLADRRVDDPNDGGATGGATPLLVAAGKGHAAVVRLLLGDKRVDPNSLTEEGASVLAIAAQEAATNPGCVEVSHHRRPRDRHQPWVCRGESPSPPRRPPPAPGVSR